MIIYHGSNIAIEKPRLIDQTLKALKVKQLYNQMVFTSVKALSYLKFIGILNEEGDENGEK